jgi:hypothetical protein
LSPTNSPFYFFCLLQKKIKELKISYLENLIMEEDAIAIT